MKFSESLKSNRDFKNVYNCKKSYANKYLVMYVLGNESERNRLGISVSKKVGNSVVRHHVTRLIRESYRLHEEMFQCGFDIVVIARVSAADAKYVEIERALLHVSKLHKILAEQDRDFDEKAFYLAYFILQEISLSNEIHKMSVFSVLLTVWS